MRRGFTLIELMVVAGIMAFLGTAAVGGYNAFQRGMAERGATGAASAILKAAKERAMIDRTPTMVVCYNRLVREAEGDDQNAVVVGEAVAIRRAGRVTYSTGSEIVDEFADILGSYDVVDQGEIDERGSIRLWKFDDTQTSQARYSIIADAVTPLLGDVKLRTYEGWANGETADDDAGIDLSTVEPKNGATHVTTKSGNMKSLVYAFHVLDAGTAGSWRIGNGYGFEFARVQLPHDFAFDGSIPTRMDDLQMVKTLYFDPERGNDESVPVMLCLPDASGMPKRDRAVGKATSEGNVAI